RRRCAALPEAAIRPPRCCWLNSVARCVASSPHGQRPRRCATRGAAMNDIATPGLVHVADLQADVSAPPIDIGDTPHGFRRVIPVLSGKVSGPRLNGRVLPGGADFQYWHADGGSEIHARYVIEADSGGRVYVENSGVRRGSPEVMAKLRRGEPVDPALIYF